MPHPRFRNYFELLTNFITNITKPAGGRDDTSTIILCSNILTIDMMLPPSKFIFLLYVSASLTTIELVIWAGNYRHREKGSPERKSESEESNTHEGIKKIEYNGTPKMRRSLAELGENAVPDAMWTKMTTSVIAREKSLDGVYALHVSKSGGEFIRMYY